MTAAPSRRPPLAPGQTSGQALGMTLVEVMVSVLIVGVLAAVAVTLYLRRTDDAHTTEATTNLSALARGAEAYFREQHTIEPGAPPVSGTFPHAPQCTSTGNRLGAADTPAAEDFALRTTFDALRWSIAKPHRYQFCYHPAPPDGPFVRAFTLTAVASIRGPADSAFVIRGSVGPDGAPVTTLPSPASPEDLAPLPAPAEPPHPPPPAVAVAAPAEGTPAPSPSVGAATSPPRPASATAPPNPATPPAPADPTDPADPADPADPTVGADDDPDPAAEATASGGGGGAPSVRRSRGGGGGGGGGGSGQGGAPPPNPSGAGGRTGCAVRGLRR